MAIDSNALQVTQQLQKVRQARQYRSDAISQEVVNELLQVARWTGSSRNTQPWHFIVVDDPSLLSQISQIRTPINWVEEAPLAIAIVLNGGSEASEAAEQGRETERLLIAAHVLGLGGGTAWFGDADQQAEAKRILGIPADRTARSVVVLGYPRSVKDPRPNPAQAGRHPIEQITSHNRYSD